MKRIDVLNNDGIRTGEILSREEIHRLGKPHRAVHLYLFDPSSHLLLQRRSSLMDHYPEMFSISLTGHVDSGETSQEALHREIQEELRLNPRDMSLRFLFSFKQDVEVNAHYIDRQFNDVYACWHDFKIADILFNTQEISEIKLVSVWEFNTMINDPKNNLAQVYAREWRDVKYFLRSQLNTCDEPNH